MNTKINRPAFLGLLLLGLGAFTFGAQAAPAKSGCCDSKAAACCVTKTRCCDTAEVCCDSENAPCCVAKVNCCEKGAQVKTVRTKKAVIAQKNAKQASAACCNTTSKTSAKARR